MTKARVEAFSDGVVAIIITIMVLELRAPQGADWPALRAVAPVFAVYVLSFVMLGIYWSNHHHLLHTVDRVTGGILWANLHLLFWLSLVPFVTKWIGEHFAPFPAAVYGVVMLLAAAAWTILERTIIASQGERSKLRQAIGRDRKGMVSKLIYAAAIPLAFVHQGIAVALYVAVALMWFVPDRRIESRLG